MSETVDFGKARADSEAIFRAALEGADPTASTDGSDGPTDAAGAFAFSELVAHGSDEYERLRPADTASTLMGLRMVRRRRLGGSWLPSTHLPHDLVV